MKLNPRIFGAFLVGAGLIGFAFYFAPVVSNKNAPNPATEIVVGAAPTREYIEIEDRNNDGTPDWHEAYRITNPDIIALQNATATVYTPPDALTGQFSIDFFEQTIRARTTGVFAPSDQEIVESSVTDVVREAEDTIYREKDITVIPNVQVTPELELEYFNQVAIIVLVEPKTPNNEALILQEALAANRPEMLEELDINEKAYETIRDKLLVLPVPSKYRREHLDLLNASNAIYQDILGMQLVFEDPLYALLRIKRYQDDATGLFYALQHYHLALEDSGIAVDVAEPAFNFIIFNPTGE